ncbi:MAG: fluoride efflux transporter CrcB [Nakamurella sp.]
MTYLWVALGAAVGAPLRYLIDRLVQSRHGSLFPWGTFTVNGVGSLILGLLTGVSLAGDAPWQWVIGTGFCGALTTYSTFAWETVRLTEQRAGVLAAVNAIANVAMGLGAATVGYLVADAVLR